MGGRCPLATGANTFKCSLGCTTIHNSNPFITYMEYSILGIENLQIITTVCWRMCVGAGINHLLVDLNVQTGPARDLEEPAYDHLSSHNVHPYCKDDAHTHTHTYCIPCMMAPVQADPLNTALFAHRSAYDHNSKDQYLNLVLFSHTRRRS